MSWMPTAADIHAVWQPQVEFAEEASSTPVLACGGSAQVLDLAPSLLAAEALAAARADLTAPLLLAGGSGPGWAALLFLERLPDLPASSPACTVLFGGPDQAGLLAGAQIARPRGRFTPPRHDLGSGYDALLRPRLAPSLPPHWETLPLWLATAPAPVAANAADVERQTWTAWAAVALAVIVLAAAFFA